MGGYLKRERLEKAFKLLDEYNVKLNPIPFYYLYQKKPYELTEKFKFEFTKLIMSGWLAELQPISKRMKQVDLIYGGNIPSDSLLICLEELSKHRQSTFRDYYDFHNNSDEFKRLLFRFNYINGSDESLSIKTTKDLNCLISSYIIAGRDIRDLLKLPVKHDTNTHRLLLEFYSNTKNLASIHATFEKCDEAELILPDYLKALNNIGCSDVSLMVLRNIDQRTDLQINTEEIIANAKTKNRFEHLITKQIDNLDYSRIFSLLGNEIQIENEKHIQDMLGSMSDELKEAFIRKLIYGFSWIGYIPSLELLLKHYYSLTCDQDISTILEALMVYCENGLFTEISTQISKISSLELFDIKTVLYQLLHKAIETKQISLARWLVLVMQQQSIPLDRKQRDDLVNLLRSSESRKP